jgi:hypothetical protein
MATSTRPKARTAASVTTGPGGDPGDGSGNSSPSSSPSNGTGNGGNPGGNGGVAEGNDGSSGGEGGAGVQVVEAVVTQLLLHSQHCHRCLFRTNLSMICCSAVVST